ncbi:DUF4922 domain-containing protein [Synechococcus elongatus IITB7]|uniref:ATP adenylyltransferase family protein n=1 Tax=Synechococcus elongatus TaxID=32046 RepID=UPI0030CD525C
MQNLLQLAQAQTTAALANGALQPIATDSCWLEDQDQRFLVRMLRGWRAKHPSLKAHGPVANPFQPYDPRLFVADAGDRHLWLLNKFPVIDQHLLLITRQYEPQTQWLNLADFEAIASGLQVIDGFAFFNGGPLAGASQPHKHLQLVPLPLDRDCCQPLPLSDRWQAALSGDRTALPFQHAIAELPNFLGLSATQAGEILFETYQKLWVQFDLVVDGDRPPAYNLLLTRQWLLIVPRSRESHLHISVNALGFAGALLVRDQAQLQQLQDLGPLQLLQTVGC